MLPPLPLPLPLLLLLLLVLKDDHKKTEGLGFMVVRMPLK
jgi:hypothetical protein